METFIDGNRLSNMNFYRTLIVLLCAAIAACSSSPESEKPQKQQVLAAKPDETRSAPTSQDYIKKALEQPQNQARSFYIQALRYAIKEQRELEYIEAIVAKIDLSKYNSVGQDIELIKALLYIEQTAQAERVIKRLQQGQLPKQYQISLWIIKAQMESAQQQHMQTVQTVFRTQELFSARLNADEEKLLNQILWKHLLKLPLTSIERFQTDFGQNNSGLLQLARIIRVHLTNPQMLVSELDRWQQLFPETAQSPNLPVYISQLLKIEPYQPQHIALVLPFSGKLSEQARHIRNGFLAAAQMNPSTRFSLIDSGKYTADEINDKLVEANPDFIVGPLLKEKVAELENSEAFISTPSLMLNSPDDLPPIPRSDSFYFGLSPEDEIAQAVEYFIAKEIKHPTVIYADNSLGRRLSQKFQELWLQASDKEAEAVAFRSKSKLGETVEELLDVNNSKRRINEMKSLLGSQLKTKTRSRVDIDAVYVIANSQQTRLIKPFFDVNVSEFAERLPIYGSSRSYVVNETRAQKRDLNGLTFTEMPWLVTSKFASVDGVYQQVGEKQTQLKKLFAFGYDAFNLIPALVQLKTLPKQSISGLTGELSIGDKMRIRRELQWSRYNRGSIAAIQPNI